MYNEQMKKTLLITIDFPPMFGGVANYWANLGKHLPGDEFFVLAPEYSHSLDFDIKQNYLIYRHNLISRSRWVWPKWLPFLYQTWKLVRLEKIKKLIVAQVLPGGTVALILKLLLRVPYVVSIHGLDLAMTQASQRKSMLARLVFRHADSIIANSEYTKNELLNTKCCDKLSVDVVYPCPNINFEEVLDSRKVKFRERFNLQGKKIVLTLGRLVERKGHDKVVEAFNQVVNRVPDAVYLIVGSGPRQELLKNKVESHGLDGRVLFFDDVLNHEIPLFLDLAEVFVMPSRQLEDGDIEGFGIVYLEANSFGKPVVAGRAGGAVEAVEHGVNGLLVDPHSVNEISQAVCSLLESPQKSRELGERGRRRVLEKFTWAEQAKVLEKIL